MQNAKGTLVEVGAAKHRRPNMNIIYPIINPAWNDWRSFASDFGTVSAVTPTDNVPKITRWKR